MYLLADSRDAAAKRLMNPEFVKKTKTLNVRKIFDVIF